MANTYKEFTGNYKEIVVALNFPFFYQKEAKEKTKARVIKDINRTRYINFTGDVDVNKQRILDSDFTSYTQGDLTGEVFSATLLTTLYARYVEAARNIDPKIENYYNTLSFSYINDNDELCGFSLSYLRDDSDSSIAPENRPYHYAIGIISGTNKPAEDKKVRVLTHSSFLENTFSGDPITGGNTISANQLKVKMMEKLDSRALSWLLNELIDENGHLNHKKFTELNERTKVEQNIEGIETYISDFIRERLAIEAIDLNNKLNQLMFSASKIEEIGTVYTQLNAQISDRQKFIQLVKQYLQLTSLNNIDANFAERYGYQDIEDLQNINSFFKFNKTPLLILGLSLITAAVGALTLTGILPTVGVLALIGIALSGLISLCASICIIKNEIKREQIKNDLKSVHQMYASFFDLPQSQSPSSENESATVTSSL